MPLLIVNGHAYSLSIGSTIDYEPLGICFHSHGAMHHTWHSQQVRPDNNTGRPANINLNKSTRYFYLVSGPNKSTRYFYFISTLSNVVTYAFSFLTYTFYLYLHFFEPFYYLPDKHSIPFQAIPHATMSRTFPRQQVQNAI